MSCIKINKLAVANTISVLCYQQCRSYFYPYASDLVSKGSRTSPFQASSVPSERDTIITEYAVAPLYGSRISAILLGSVSNPRAFAVKKPFLSLIIDDILKLQSGTVTLGETRWLSNSTMPRHTSPQYRRMDMTTGETLANCLVAVHLPSEVPIEEVMEEGLIIANAICGDAIDTRLTHEGGVTYCEFEIPDFNECRLDKVGGKIVDAEEVMLRWFDRHVKQQQLWESKYGRAKSGREKES